MRPVGDGKAATWRSVVAHWPGYQAHAKLRARKVIAVPDEDWTKPRQSKVGANARLEVTIVPGVG